jgi:hypothetical protein
MFDRRWQVINSREMSLRVVGSGLHADELLELTRNLREELLSLRVDDVVPEIENAAPPGAKAIESVALGALVVSVAPTLAGAVVGVVASWIKRQTLDVEVVIDGQHLRGSVTPEQRKEIVAAYLRRTDRAGPS